MCARPQDNGPGKLTGNEYVLLEGWLNDIPIVLEGWEVSEDTLLLLVEAFLGPNMTQKM